MDRFAGDSPEWTPSIEQTELDTVHSFGDSLDMEEQSADVDQGLLLPPKIQVTSCSDDSTVYSRQWQHNRPDTIVIQRRLYTQAKLDEAYRDEAEDSRSPFGTFRAACQCSKQCVVTYLMSLLPLVTVLRFYQWKNWLLVDLLAGLSVAFIHLPQGLAYGILASLRPINGLYTSFFPVVTYLIFGSSPHISMGTNAVIALPIADLVDRKAELFFGDGSANSTVTEEERVAYKVGLSAAVCLLSGVILLAMGLLRLGFVTDYLAKSFIGGFTFAAAVHIVTSQVPKLLHINMKRRTGLGNVIMTYVDIFSNISDSNPADVIIGLISMVVLLAVKIGINERYKMQLKVPVPIELIVVVLSTVISHFAKLNDRFGVAVVGDVPTGLPAPTLPPMEAVPLVAYETLAITTICFALTIALGKICAKMHDYEINDNQELVAYGMCQLVGCVFQSFPASTAPPRTMMLSSMGSKTTLNGLTTAVLILLVLLVAGQLFVSLPIAMLAAMIIVAMKDLLLQVNQLRSLYHVNKPDFFIWLFTAFVSIFDNLALGLVLGVGFSMLSVLTVSKLAGGTMLGKAEREDILVPTTRRGINALPGIKIFRFESQLFFASAERFKTQLYSLVFVPGKHHSKPALVELEIDVPEPVEDETEPELTIDFVRSDPASADSTERVHHVIIDCSPMTYIDVSGIDMLELIIMQYSGAGVEVFLADIPPATLATLHRAKFLDSWGKDKVFFNVHDAVQAALQMENVHSVFSEMIIKLQ